MCPVSTISCFLDQRYMTLLLQVAQMLTCASSAQSNCISVPVLGLLMRLGGSFLAMERYHAFVVLHFFVGQGRTWISVTFLNMVPGRRAYRSFPSFPFFLPSFSPQTSDAEPSVHSVITGSHTT
ncbi:hypothetical protein EDC04DRAFT_2697488, partial [Pisolithus marmoratus]